jgi:hypothetical protein
MSARIAGEGRMLSGRGRNLAGAVASLATLCTLSMTPAAANPATVNYQCRPALQGGGLLAVDFNSGASSVTAQFPGGRSIRMPGRTARSYFRYTAEHVKIYGTGQSTVTLTMMGQPTRKCVAAH